MDTNRPAEGDDGWPAARPEESPMPMLIAEARVETERASRYLVQLCRHAAAMGAARVHDSRMHLHSLLARRQVQVTADWSETFGTVAFAPWGRCTVTADPATLVLRVEAADEQSLRRIQDVVTEDLGRFGRRDELTLNWCDVGA